MEIKKIFGILMFVLVLISCSVEKKEVNLLTEKISEINQTLPYFKIDSVILNNSKLNLYLSDSAVYYCDTRHYQNYEFISGMLFNKEYLQTNNVDSMIIKTQMPLGDRKVIMNRISRKGLNQIVTRYDDPCFKNKIVRLNKLNFEKKKEYYDINRYDLIDRLNAYFASKTKEGYSTQHNFTGIDSYLILKSDCEAKGRNQKYLDYNKLEFDILNEKEFWKNKKTAKELLNIIRE